MATLLEEKLIKSKEVKKFIDFLNNESNDKDFTEFEVRVTREKKCFVYVKNDNTKNITIQL